MIIHCASSTNIESPETLALRLVEARRAGHEGLANRVFQMLVESVNPVLKRHIARYHGSRSESEIRQDALLCLWKSVEGFSLHLGRHPGKSCAFAAFLDTCLHKALALAHHREKASDSHEGVKSQRKVARWRHAAREDGVDIANPQAVFNHAVASGERPTIVLRYLHRLGGAPVSLDAPVRNHDGESGRALIDFIAERAEMADDEEVADLVRLALRTLDILTVKQRATLIRLHGLDGLAPATVAQIARAEGVSACTVAERRDSAYKALRNALRPRPTPRPALQLAA